MPFLRVCSIVIVVVLLLGEAVAVPTAVAAPLRLESAPADGPGLLLGLDDRQPTAATSDLRRPPAPTDNPRPRFVRQTGKNCAFASAAMLIDKWTNGKVRPSQERLRRASRVPASEGVSFAELSRAVARATDFDLRFSPGGGDPLTWSELLSRLARGGGAVLGGSFSRLPRHYQRHARDFAALGARESGHAVYIERYEPRRGGGRVWLMDPLARRAGYSGEWISVRALRGFAWVNSRGLVTAAATPEPPPLAGYEFGQLELEPWAIAGQKISLSLPVTVASGWPAPDKLALQVSWELLVPEPEPGEEVAPDEASQGEDPELSPMRAAGEAPESEQASGDESGESAAGEHGPQRVKLELRKGALRGTLRTPAEPGSYRLTGELRRRDGTSFGSEPESRLAPLNVRLHGPLAAEYALVSPVGDTLHGPSAEIVVAITNRGGLDWQAKNSLQLSAGWETAFGDFEGGSVAIELASGEQGLFSLPVDVPVLVNQGVLRVELLSGSGVPLSALGYEPLLVPLTLVSEPLLR